MKQYMKYIMIPVFISLMIALTVCNEGEISISDLILKYSFGKIGFVFAEMGNMLLYYFPILFFHIFFGTYIYRHYCSGAIYYFSRINYVRSWFLKECVKLLGFVVLYLLILISSCVIFGILIDKTRWNNEVIKLIMNYILIYSLFVFATTLAINIISIRLSDSRGFLIVEGILFMFIAIFFMIGEKYFSDGIIPYNMRSIIYINPISHIIFAVNNINIAFVFWLICSIVAVYMGTLVIKKHVFIKENTEG